MFTPKGSTYDFKFTCKFCGKIGYSNRSKQHFCNPPKRCRSNYWSKKAKDSRRVEARVSKLEDELREIKKGQKGGGKHD